MGISLPNRRMRTFAMTLFSVSLFVLAPSTAEAANAHPCVRYDVGQRSTCLRNIVDNRLRTDQFRQRRECNAFQGIENRRCMRYGAQYARDNRQSYRWQFLQYVKDRSAYTQPLTTREQPINYSILVRRCMEQNVNRGIAQRRCLRKARLHYE